eukprot:Skav235671  [mRNA]  locus=scaffold358:1184411:1188233:+ [translate_table: standard]
MSLRYPAAISFSSWKPAPILGVCSPLRYGPSAVSPSCPDFVMPRSLSVASARLCGTTGGVQLKNSFDQKNSAGCGTVRLAGNLDYVSHRESSRKLSRKQCWYAFVIIGSIIFLYGVLWVFDRLTEGPNAPPTP